MAVGELAPHLTECAVAEAYIHAKWQLFLIRPTVWPQYTNVTDRTHRTDEQRSDSMGRTGTNFRPITHCRELEVSEGKPVNKLDLDVS